MFEPLHSIEIEFNIWDRDTKDLSKALWVHRQHSLSLWPFSDHIPCEEPQFDSILGVLPAHPLGEMCH